MKTYKTKELIEKGFSPYMVNLLTVNPNGVKVIDKDGLHILTGAKEFVHLGLVEITIKFSDKVNLNAE